jgi:8-amino-7-oxononanoate synthase
MTNPKPSLVAIASRHAQQRANDVAYRYLADDGAAQTLTYGELDQRAAGIAAEIARRAEPGDRALLVYPHGLEFIAAFLACLYAGVVAVPVNMPRRGKPPERLRTIAGDCRAQLLLTTSEQSDFLASEFAAGDIRPQVISTDAIDIRVNPSEPKRAVGIEDIAFIQYTSGSTRTPRGVVVTHDNLVSNEESIRVNFGHTPQSVMVSWLPLFHDMGLIGGVLQPLHVGFPSILMSPATFLREPVRWLRAISEYRDVTSGAPNFAYDYCVGRVSDEEKRTLDLSNWRVAYNGAEPVRAATLRRFADEFGDCGFRAEAFFPCYGMAETTLLVSGGPALRPPVTVNLDAHQLEKHVLATPTASHASRELVSCGQIGAGTQVAIVDWLTRHEATAEAIGEIWATGGSVSKAYWQRPDESNETMGATLEGREGLWLKTGDLGFIRDGELFVTGRLKDLVVVRGRNLYPQDVEATVERTLTFVTANTCAAFSVDVGHTENLILVVEADRALTRAATKATNSSNNGLDPAAIASRVCQAIVEEFEVAPSAILFVKPGSFPRTSSGKVQRNLCRDKYLAKTLSVVFAWGAETYSPQPTREDAVAKSNGHLQRLAGIICQAASEWLEDRDNCRVDVDPATSLMSLGIDSVGATHIAVVIEAQTGVRLSPDVVYSHETADRLARFIAARPACGIEAANGHAGAEGQGEHPPVGANGADWLTHFQQMNRRVDTLKRDDRYFFETPIERIDGNSVMVDGKRLLMFGSYSYLGLAGDPDILAASHESSRRYGTGAHGVRLLAGTCTQHRELERRLADFMRAEDAIVFSSGFVTNVSTIGSLVGPGDLVIGDELNHASLHDGCRSSGAEFGIFPHNDLQELELLIAKAQGRRVMVVIDAVYSMEGDIAPLPNIVRLCKRAGALLMVDEAHSLGVLGQTGHGIQQHFDLPADAIDVKMGTLSKAIPSCGGFVAGMASLVQYLRHHAKGYIFSSALPAPALAAALESFKVIEQQPQRTAWLRRNAARFLKGLRELGYKIPDTQSAIIPVVFSDETQALEATRLCRERGLFVVPVLYPAVPMNAPRLRMTVMATHTDEEIDFAIEVMADVARELGVAAETTAPLSR